MEKFDTEICTERQFEKWYWKDLNKTCIECKNDCKQSDKVLLLNCDKYEIGV